MNVPDILGCECTTPDGRGSVLSLRNNKVHVTLNTIDPQKEMIGSKRTEMHYAYDYQDVEIIKGRYKFKEDK